MDITPLIEEGRHIITVYGNGGFTINKDKQVGSILLFPTLVVSLPVSELEELTTDHLSMLTQSPEIVDLLLVGGGKKLAHLPVSVKAFLSQEHIIPEYMDTGAACRTYNVLLAEGRRVAALLIAV